MSEAEKKDEDEDEAAAAALLDQAKIQDEKILAVIDEVLLEEGIPGADAASALGDGFSAALITGGFAPSLARAISHALGEDERIVEIIAAGQTPLRYMTRQDAKVDDKICLPQQGDIWAKEDPRRPRIPISNHPNCRCFWQDPITGANLGQF